MSPVIQWLVAKRSLGPPQQLRKHFWSIVASLLDPSVKGRCPIGQLHIDYRSLLAEHQPYNGSYGLGYTRSDLHRCKYFAGALETHLTRVVQRGCNNVV